MKKKLAVFVLVFALLAMSAVAVAAETGTVTITGGTLSVAAADVTLSGVTLDGTDKTSTSASGDNSWSATDARGTGAGWNLTIAATDFSDGDTTPKIIDIAQADSEFKIQLLDANVTVTAGNTKPVSQVTTLSPIPDTGSLKILSAAGDTGMGAYAIAPNFELEIPAETYVGLGTYTSTITVTAVTGP